MTPMGNHKLGVKRPKVNWNELRAAVTLLKPDCWIAYPVSWSTSQGFYARAYVRVIVHGSDKSKAEAVDELFKSYDLKYRAEWDAPRFCMVFLAHKNQFSNLPKNLKG